MRVLVFGKNSSIGRDLQLVLPASDDIKYLGRNDCNMLDVRSVESRIYQFESDIVINLAAKCGGIFDNIARPYDYLTQNIVMQTNVIEACLDYGVNKALFMGSSCSYPDLKNPYLFPLREHQLHDGPPAASNAGYGLAKRLLQDQVDLCNQQMDTRYSYFILTNLYGRFSRFDENSHFLGKLIRKILDYKSGKLDKIQMNGASTARRSYLSTKDVARFIKNWLSNDCPLIKYNVAPKENRTIKEIADITLSAFECDAKIEFLDESMVGQTLKNMSSAKFMETPVFDHFTGLREGLEQIYAMEKECQ